MLRITLTLILLGITTAATAGNGLVKVESSHSVERTAERLVQVLEEKGMTVMARVDHAGNAEKAGMSLRPTQLVIFGNPEG